MAKGGGIATGKPAVIEHLFGTKWDPATGSLSQPVVTSSELVAAIDACNRTFGTNLSTKNPANFLKDFLRSNTRNINWPTSLKAKKITARQKYRKGRVFAFVPYEVGQSEPFPDPFVVNPSTMVHVIEAVSLPSDARALGRGDEAWLIQVCVNQRILQTHFAVHSSLDVVDLFHLQNSLKATPEIDAIFLATVRNGKTVEKCLMTLEAKRNEPILTDQIRAQVAYIAKQCQTRPQLRSISKIIPVAARGESRQGNRVISIFEMGCIEKDVAAALYDSEQEHTIQLSIRSSVSYSLQPAVSGI